MYVFFMQAYYVYIIIFPLVKLDIHIPVPHQPTNGK